MPLFPLQTVLFPGMRLLLKVFEARYLDLVSGCLREQKPFGVLALRSGGEVGIASAAAEMEEVGVLARIDEVDGEASGILRLRCTGTLRFRRNAEPQRQADGLWTCTCDELPADAPHVPGAAMLQTVRALAAAIKSLGEQGRSPFDAPYRFDDCGWVANRWCELLPLPLAAKQKLLEIDDPVLRLSV
ncbi:MAG: LON peptidase substrate-binding domain-containing protein, partial [Burkholderiales bacterium]|nr:LON peptidase substrate-binding domain-containing protein [Burkholderiales bacterium]